MDKIEQTARKWLKDRGVTPDDIAELVYFLQQQYYPNLTKEDCLQNVERVLSKREVQNAILTGIQLDVLAEKGVYRSLFSRSSNRMKDYMELMKFLHFPL